MEKTKSMSFPATREALEAAGWKRSNYSRCKGCRVPIEWWFTASGERMPMEHMPDPGSAAVSHWATCVNAKDFRKRKEPQSCKVNDSPEQSSLFTSPQPSVKNTENERNGKS